MTEQNPFAASPPPFTWVGDVQLRPAHSAVEVAEEIQVHLRWTPPVNPAECLISLRDSHGAVVWSEKIATGVPEVRFRLLPTVTVGTYTLELSLDRWILAQERIDVLD